MHNSYFVLCFTFLTGTIIFLVYLNVLILNSFIAVLAVTLPTRDQAAKQLKTFHSNCRL